MVFSSNNNQVYLNPPNWNDKHQQLSYENPHPPPPPPPPPSGSIRPGSMADRARLAKLTPPETAQKCPRCDSSNTKFCYFNNYSLSQPRHLCKTCKRYWTRGGALRNVPVGGGCRRNKKSKNNRSKSPATTEKSTGCTTEITGHQLPPQLPPLFPRSSQNLTYGGFDGISAQADLSFQMGPLQRFPFFAGGEEYCSLFPAGSLIGESQVKMEENQWKNLAKEPFLGMSQNSNNHNNNNNQYWSGNMWKDLL